MSTYYKCNSRIMSSAPTPSSMDQYVPDYIREAFGVAPVSSKFLDYSPWTLRVKCEGPLPTRSSEKAAGYDLHSPQDVVIPAGGSAVIDTGVAVALPSGHYGKIEGRSGLGIKHDIVPFGGVIDEDYRGNIAVKLFNFGNEDYSVTANDRIAQMVIQPYANLKIKRVETLDETERGASGFGSSGR